MKVKICYVVSADITLKFLLFSNILFLKNKNYDVSVVCSPGKWLKEFELEGIHVKTITIKRKAFTPFSDVVSLFQLYWHFKKEKFDIVHTFTPKPGLLGQMSAKFARVPIIFNTVFGFYFHEKTPYFKKRFFIFIEKEASRYSDKIFFRNQEDFNTAESEKIGTFDKNTYLGDGIDIERFNPEKFPKRSIIKIKKNLGINVAAPVIGIVARLVKEKGYFELFKAFKKVLERFPNAILLVIGSEDLIKKDRISKDVVKNFGIENNVVFLGERTDMDQLYAVFDIFVLPSYREGFSHSIMEASAMALPIIASDIRGCRGAVENGHTGILVPAKNTEKLAEAIIYLISNPKEAEKMGKFARKKAKKEFDQRVIFEKTEEEYKKLLQSIK